MIMNGQETFFLEMNKQACSYTMYFPMIFNKTFNLLIYKRAVDYLLNEVPHLKRKGKEHFWRATWVPIKNFDINDLFQIQKIDATECDEIEKFYSKAILYFYEMKDKLINLNEEPPLKFKVISDNDNNWSMVVLCIHHSIADGRGSMQIMSTISDVYTAIVNKSEMPKIKNYRKIPYHLLKESLLKILVRTFTTKENPLAIRNTINLVDCDNEVSKEENFICLKIPREKITQLKELYKEWNYTTNDIIVYQLLLICYKLIDNNDGEKPVFNVGIAIDSRKNIKKDILTITNYASMCPFYIEKDTLEDKTKVQEELQKFKTTASGLRVSKELLFLALLPCAIQKKVLGGSVKNMIKELSCRGIQTTNVGELTRFVGNYNNSLKYVEFIGPAGHYGMPILSISLYEGNMTIYFRRTNDSNDICNKIKDLLNEQLNNYK